MTTISSIGSLLPQPPHLDEHQPYKHSMAFSSQQSTLICTRTNLRDSEPPTEYHLRNSLVIPTQTPPNLLSLPGEPLGAKYPKISDMIKLAIWDSPQKKLTLRQIYEWVENHYPSLKYKKNKPWERSIRHNLSWKAIFVQVKRPANHPGNGNYWTVDFLQGDGNKHKHKKKESPRGGQELRKESESDETSEVNSLYVEDTNLQQPTVSLHISGGVSCPSNGKLTMPLQMMECPIINESRMYTGAYQNMLSAPSSFLPKGEGLMLVDHRSHPSILYPSIPYPYTDLVHSIHGRSSSHSTEAFPDGCAETSRGTGQYIR